MTTEAAHPIDIGYLKGMISGSACVAFIGSGVSKPAYMIWDELMVRLVSDCVDSDQARNAIEADALNEAGVLVKSMNIPSVYENTLYNQIIADKLKAIDGKRYIKALSKLFKRPSLKSYHAAARKYHLLARTDFCAYVTTNFDPLLLDVVAHHHNIEYSCHPDPSGGGFSSREVVFLHGRIGLVKDSHKWSDKLVFTHSEFNRAYGVSGPLISPLSMMFRHHDVLFLGCRLSDPSLIEVARACRAHLLQQSNPSRPKWVALVEDEEVKEAVEYTKSVGISVVPYSKLGSGYPGFEEILRELSGAEKPKYIHGVRRKSPFQGGEEPQR